MKDLTIGTNQFEDSDTGEIITFDDIESAQNELLKCESFIGNAVAQMAFGLKELKDKKLYLLRCDSFRDYCDDFLSISIRQAYNYIALAAAYNHTVLQKNKNLSIKKLLDLAKDESVVDGLNSGETEVEGDKVLYADGSSESLDAVIERVKKKTKKESQKAVQEQKALVDLKTEHIKKIEKQKRDKDQRIKELKEGLDNLAKMKDVDVSRLNYIKSQDEAALLIDEVMVETGQLLGGICQIMPELIDAKLAGKFTTMIASVEASLHSIKEQFGDQVLFAQGPRPSGVLPE